MESLLEHGSLDSDLLSLKNDIDPYLDRIRENLLIIKKEAGDNVLKSLIHMSINRMFRSSQRLYELSIYHTLKRYYVGLAFRKK